MVTLTITNLYAKDKTIFDLMKIPADVDKTKLVNNILFECADLEVLYPDTALIKNLIGIWSDTLVDIWERFNKTVNLEYDPLENYDRREEWTDNASGNSSQNSTASGNDSNTNTEKVSAFNSTGFENRAQATSTGENSTTGSTTGEAESESTHTGRVHGNIGVTTAQQMLKSEIDLLPELCVYDYITAAFKARFCILVY